MKRDTVLLAYGELSLKSRPVRRMLEDRVVKQASLTLRRAGVRKFSVYRKQGRIIVKCDEAEKAAEEVKAEMRKWSGTFLTRDGVERWVPLEVLRASRLAYNSGR